MARLTQTLRNRLDHRRSRHEIERAIANAGSATMRDELLIAAQRYTSPFSR